MTKRSLSSWIVILVLALGTVNAVLAFDYPLSSTAIRDAYFLGNRNDEQTAEFLSKYVHRFPMPKSGPYVEEIGLDTPFTQVVRRAQTALSYNAPDAVEEFQRNHLPLRVHVDIALTLNYSPIRETTAPTLYQWVPDFWNDFKVQLIQNGEIPAMKRRGGPVYAYGYVDFPLVTGAHIELDYDPAKVESAPVNIEVVMPDGQKVETIFDLGRLC